MNGSSSSLSETLEWCCETLNPSLPLYIISLELNVVLSEPRMQGGNLGPELYSQFNFSTGSKYLPSNGLFHMLHTGHALYTQWEHTGIHTALACVILWREIWSSVLGH